MAVLNERTENAGADEGVVACLESRLPADRDPVLVYIGTLKSRDSQLTMVHALNDAANVLRPGARATQIDWTRVEYQHTAKIQRDLMERGLKPRTVNKIVSAVRSVLRTCWELGLVEHEHYAKAARVKTLKTSTLLIGRQLKHEEISRLFEHCLGLGTTSGLRDAALLAALVGAGLRRAEVVGLSIEDYDHEEQSLRVVGKGDKERVAFLMEDDAAAIEAWLGARGNADGPLFCPVLKNGTVSIRNMTKQAVYAAMTKRAEQLGLEHFSPHSLRRTLISSLLEAGVDLLQVQDQVGHASPSTTKRYDLRPASARRAAIRSRLTLLRGGRRAENDGREEGGEAVVGRAKGGA